MFFQFMVGFSCVYLVCLCCFSCRIVRLYVRIHGNFIRFVCVALALLPRTADASAAAAAATVSCHFHVLGTFSLCMLTTLGTRRHACIHVNTRAFVGLAVFGRKSANASDGFTVMMRTLSKRPVKQPYSPC